MPGEVAKMFQLGVIALAGDIFVQLKTNTTLRKEISLNFQCHDLVSCELAHRTRLRTIPPLPPARQWQRDGPKEHFSSTKQVAILQIRMSNLEQNAIIPVRVKKQKQ
jgi:hypothetical protein